MRLIGFLGFSRDYNLKVLCKGFVFSDIHGLWSVSWFETVN